MKNVEEEIKNYFAEKEIPPINEEKVKELQTATLQNKRKKSFWYSFKKYGLATACLLIVIVSAILIPIFTKSKEKYYADDEATIISESLTLEYTSNYIEENYPKYSFVFEDYTIFSILGLYAKDTNKLLGIRLEGEKNSVPFTYLNLCLVVNVNFTPKERSFYTKNTQKEEREKYILYSKEVSGVVYSEFFWTLDYKNYSLYIKVNCSDFEAIEKFL